MTAGRLFRLLSCLILLLAVAFSSGCVTPHGDSDLPWNAVPPNDGVSPMPGMYR